MRFKSDVVNTEYIHSYLSSGAFPNITSQIKFLYDDGQHGLDRSDYTYVCIFDKTISGNNSDFPNPIVAVAKYGIYGDSLQYVGNNYYSVAESYGGLGLGSKLADVDLHIKTELTEKIIKSGNTPAIKLHNYYDFSSMATMSIKPKILSNISSLISKFSDIMVIESISGSSKETILKEIDNSKALIKDISSIPIYGRGNDFRLLNSYGFARNKQQKYKSRTHKNPSKMIHINISDIALKCDHFYYISPQLSNGTDNFTFIPRGDRGINKITYRVVEYKEGQGIREQSVSFPISIINGAKAANLNNIEDLLMWGYSSNKKRYNDISFITDRDLFTDSLNYLFYSYYSGSFKDASSLCPESPSRKIQI